jgi:hypothetical protein
LQFLLICWHLLLFSWLPDSLSRKDPRCTQRVIRSPYEPGEPRRCIVDSCAPIIINFHAEGTTELILFFAMILAIYGLLVSISKQRQAGLNVPCNTVVATTVLHPPECHMGSGHSASGGGRKLWAAGRQRQALSYGVLFPIRLFGGPSLWRRLWHQGRSEFSSSHSRRKGRTEYQSSK